MAENTNIEWCDATFNPWIGCTRVSPACDDCYAARSTPARTLGIEWGAGQPRRRTADDTWAGPKVFCSSLADWLDNEAPIEWLVDLLDLIRCTPDLDWLLLSKRIGNWGKRLQVARQWCVHQGRLELSCVTREWLQGYAPANIWLGATVVNQAEADRDVPKLLAVPARVRFLSIEPMLGPIDLRRIDVDGDHEIHPLTGTTECVDGEGDPAPDIPGLDWVICGGESGPKARPMHPDWARSLRDQCAAAGTAFLFKQWGEWGPFSRPSHYPAGVAPDGSVVGPDEQFTEDCALMYRIGKAAAGRLLDGRTHDGFPEVSHA
jgi:protein gp37